MIRIKSVDLSGALYIKSSEVRRRFFYLRFGDAVWVVELSLHRLAVQSVVFVKALSERVPFFRVFSSDEAAALTI